MKEKNEDRLRLDSERNKAAQYFMENFTREERYLKVFSRDFSGFLKSADYLLKKDTANQYYFDFLLSFEELKDKMMEFRWSKEFLLENGIDFVSIKKLYFAVA